MCESSGNSVSRSGEEREKKKKRKEKKADLSVLTTPKKVGQDLNKILFFKSYKTTKVLPHLPVECTLL